MNYDWNLINSFTPWFLPFWTISAVVVALYLSRKDKPKIRITNEIKILISMLEESRPKYIIIEITNIGIRPVKIISVGWTVGLFKKQHFIQIPSQLFSANLPNYIE